jgi:putative membrane protein insertion efficiency factor
MAQISFIFQKIACLLIGIYKYCISPWLRPSCRYYPSCSDYANEAIKQFGVTRGTWKATKRILRCHPWSVGGYDPIQPNNEKF